MFEMRRREFLPLVVAAVAWPLGAKAQQSRMPVLGVLGSASAGGYASTVQGPE